jgi:diguanylate cyclase
MRSGPACERPSLPQRWRSGTVGLSRRPDDFSGGATLGLIVVLLSITSFAMWSAESTHKAADAAFEATSLSDDYGVATRALSAEESLERKYRLEPGPDIRVAFTAASTEFSAAVGRLSANGTSEDRSRVATISQIHAQYLAAVYRLFDQVDRRALPAAQLTDSQEVDPLFELMSPIVISATVDHQRITREALQKMRWLGTFTSRATPVVFIVGLFLVAFFASMLRRVRLQLHSQREQALHDSMHDTLTGLPNRALLAERFEQALASGKQSQKATGLLLVDLDRFKEVNDTLGHQCGDELLKQVGIRLTQALRDVDTVARLGGDEFAVVIPTVDCLDEVFVVAERLRTALAEPMQVNGIDLDVEASIGVVISGEHGQDATTLLQRADVAMYVAKEQSLGVFAYVPTADSNSPQRLALLGQLRRALDRDELVLHYQPKINLATSQVCGVEALVRWQHPERGLLPPDDFIPLAEHTGLIGPLTHYVLNAALGQVHEWRLAGHDIAVAVNLSARNLLDDHVVTQVRTLLLKHDVPAHLLQLEVTESAIMIEQARAQDILNQLHQLGIRISIDDFGAGYTSLAQLKTLPVHEIKVDRSFVSSMDNDCDAALIVRSVIDLGHNLGLTAVAEGVESHESLSTLTGAGCDIGQGFHLSRPLPAADLLAWYVDRIAEPTVTVAS